MLVKNVEKFTGHSPLIKLIMKLNKGLFRINTLSTAPQILHHKFFTYRQLERQSFHDFITKLKRLSTECEFKDFRDSLIKDMIVCGPDDNAFRERFPRESDLTLSRVIIVGNAAEDTRKHAHKILQFQSIADLHKTDDLHKLRLGYL